VNQWMIGCSRLYRRLARAFPHEFRMVCGDGLEQLGVDVVPLVWREQVFLALRAVLRISLCDCRWNTYQAGQAK